jgi:nucleotide-binding universal stress UspA family protein
MKTILVPVDFSDVTPALVEAAKAFAKAFGSHVILLNVMHSPQMAVSPMGQTIALERDVKKDYLQLNELIQQIEKAGISATCDQPQGTPAEVILEESAKKSVDLIIMGSHGHGAIYNLLVGSVTEGVLKSAKCPVVVVPSKQS